MTEISSFTGEPPPQIKHLYVHVPFCPRICPYCAFPVIVAHRSGMKQWLPIILEEYSRVVPLLKVETLFLGGGTPTALSTMMLDALLGTLLENALDSWEVTVECNPSTLPLEKARMMRARGVNRLSIGAQSFDQKILRLLGRSHAPKAIRDCVSTARIAGFENINIDLIFGVPGQTLDIWRATLEETIDLGVEHVSCYGLTYEEDTDFFQRRQCGELRENMPLEREMFQTAVEMLSSVGLHPYEISNFSKLGKECLHNLSYWRGTDYVGIGPGAVSTIQGVRTRNSKFKGEPWQVEEREVLSMEILASERMALGLRCREGVDEDGFASRFGFLPSERWEKEIHKLMMEGLMEPGAPLRLTPRGREVADEVAVYFMPNR